MTEEERAEEENNVGILYKKSYEELEKENEQLKKENEQLRITCQNNLEDMIKEKRKINEIRNYLAYDIPHELMNEATNKIWGIL